MDLKKAFEAVCNEATPAEAVFVSLYENAPFYGGPEEGGWWGSDTHLIAYQRFETKEAAEEAKRRVDLLAGRLSEDAKRAFGDQCLRDMDWLEERGLEADFLPEVDGESEFWVAIEEQPGSHSSMGCRHYE